MRKTLNSSSRVRFYPGGRSVVGFADDYVPAVEAISASVGDDGPVVHFAILGKPAEGKTGAPAVDADDLEIRHGHGKTLPCLRCASLPEPPEVAP